MPAAATKPQLSTLMEVRIANFLALRTSFAAQWSAGLNHQLGQLDFIPKTGLKPRLQFLIELAQDVGLQPCLKCGAGFYTQGKPIPKHEC